jgi:hypothetical protein
MAARQGLVARENRGGGGEELHRVGMANDDPSGDVPSHATILPHTLAQT